MNNVIKYSCGSPTSARRLGTRGTVFRTVEIRCCSQQLNAVLFSDYPLQQHYYLPHRVSASFVLQSLPFSVSTCQFFQPTKSTVQFSVLLV